MNWYMDGDHVCITKDDFIDLQESPAVFTHEDSEYGEVIRKGGLLALPFGDLMFIRNMLELGGGSI